ncbi:ABC-type transporter Mla maintaining outer membrane lipid asymmetry, component MlaD [Mariprofundus ferrinatatus]|uniref:ABC-type transporter Mla maintaining outer membrane lipid asymmetry, component MlaD n=1 Tax=Mariprofundus ferrinatatus TaxID=1921087 RepID=A0A2K8L666_9PROT|nr:MlaD family protein [Mariprofundus ferrinatatus]ATX82820.1 ABC-type transporter Mla maintaining outer membrane lipid asymmetry, component MlaD [Mariprofundus ferrinatatus]
MSQFVANIHRQVGWFVILGIGAILFLLLAFSLRTDLFANKFNLLFSPTSASSFYVDQPLKYQGFTVGRIDDMELQEDGRVLIRLRVLERYRPIIHEGTYVQLTREGLIGEQTLEISGGDAGKPPVQDGQTIEYRTAATVEQLLQDIKPAVENANRLLSEMAALAAWLNNPESDIRLVTARLNLVSQDLNRENVGKLITNLADALENLKSLTQDLEQQQVAKQLSTALEASASILTNLRPLAAQVGREGPESLKRINSLIDHVNRLSKSLDIVTSDLSELTPELPGLARESRQAIAEMQDILKSMRGSWLVGGGTTVKPEDETVAPPVLEMKP